MVSQSGKSRHLYVTRNYSQKCCMDFWVKHGFLFIALFFECTRNICQLFLILEENGVAISLDSNKNMGYVLVNCRDQEWCEGLSTLCCTS